jgi:hypothetical protein
MTIGDPPQFWPCSFCCNYGYHPVKDITAQTQSAGEAKIIELLQEILSELRKGPVGTINLLNEDVTTGTGYEPGGISYKDPGYKTAWIEEKDSDGC